MTTFVTGVGGFVGFHVSKELAKRGEEVIGVDSLLEHPYSSIEKMLRMSELEHTPGVLTHVADVSELSSLGKKYSVETVIHCAAQAGLSSSWEHPNLQLENNIFATDRLINSIEQLGSVKRIVFISTSSVYGKFAKASAERSVDPVSPYGYSKYFSELLVQKHHDQTGTPFSIIRLFSVYGPHQRPDMAYRRAIEAAISGRNFTVYGTGDQTRANTYVEDAARGICDAALQSTTRSETFDLGGEELVSLNRALELIEGLSNSQINKVYKDIAKGDQVETLADIKHAREHHGFRNETPLETGLANQIEWVRTLLQGR